MIGTKLPLQVLLPPEQRSLQLSKVVLFMQIKLAEVLSEQANHRIACLIRLAIYACRL